MPQSAGDSLESAARRQSAVPSRPEGGEGSAVLTHRTLSTRPEAGRPRPVGDQIPITACRACGNRTLLPILDLGDQALTSIFPSTRDEAVPRGPPELVRCSPEGCGLVQLRHTADLTAIHGDRYECRSGVRPYMVGHLRDRARAAAALVDLEPGDLVVDIGSNDGTLLRNFAPGGPTLVGVDPTGEKWRAHYPPHVDLIPDFFDLDTFRAHYGDRRARLVTSIAMFYNLPDPVAFMRDVHAILADDGVWMIEVSNLTSMLDSTAYDVMCHEHLGLYSLRVIEWMAEQAGLTVISAEITEVYNGSLCVVLARTPTRHRVDEAGIARIREEESRRGLHVMEPFEQFAARSLQRRAELREFLADSRDRGLLTLGYGASIKGNVILQFCGITEDDLPCFGDVSPEKAGGFSPGTGIPVVSGAEAKAMHPDQLLVLPWIYRAGFEERETPFREGGGKMIFPLPTLDIIRARHGPGAPPAFRPPLRPVPQGRTARHAARRRARDDTRRGLPPRVRTRARRHPRRRADGLRLRTARPWESVRGFEAEFAAHHGLPHCTSVDNGTNALKLALEALGVGPGAVPGRLLPGGARRARTDRRQRARPSQGRVRPPEAARGTRPARRGRRGHPARRGAPAPDGRRPRAPPGQPRQGGRVGDDRPRSRR